jgi:4-amino-4-deoxy-L-arabinose transferase-like glycosyltransferase
MNSTGDMDRQDTLGGAARAADPAVTATADAPGRIRAWAASLVGERPWWAIAGWAAIAVLALVLYLWALSRNGMANSYYAAAVKSATVSWKAFLFGSLDPGSFITVDKPPAAIWVMAVFGRVFGFSSWSMLIPQALAGTASVLVLHRLVRRWRGDVAALLAALAFALTPVAVLIFRYNNPDAFLTLLLLLATWSFWAGLRRASTGKLVLTGVILGFAFLTKMLMALLIIPALGIVYLFAGKPKLGRRILQLVAALVALVVSAGWWVVLVQLWPATGRPHVGGTTADSWIALILGRTAGVLETSSQASNLSGEPGLFRIFNAQLGSQVAWLLPLALTGLVVGLAVAGRARRIDRRRAGYLLWGLWALVMIGVFDMASGTLHSYYTVLLAPAVAALAGAGAVEAWDLGRRRHDYAWILPVAVAGTAVLSFIMLGRASGYAPGLATAVLVLGIVGAVGLLAVMIIGPRPTATSTGSGGRLFRCAAGALAAVTIVALLAGPFAYSVSTIGRSVTGNTAAAGPRGGGANTAGNADVAVDSGLVTYLERNKGQAEYLVAVQATAVSVPIILKTGEPVVTMGGYKSRDPYPTLKEMQALVSSGRLRYVLITSSSSSKASATTSSMSRATLQAVTDWVLANGKVVDAAEYGGSDTGTLYLLGT